MAERTLTALVEAKENLTDALENIEDALEETATAARAAAEETEETAQATEELARTATESASAIAGEREELEGLSVDARNAATAKESVSEANQDLGRVTRRVSRTINDENRVLTELAIKSDNAGEFLNELTQAGIITARQMEQLQEKIDDVTVAEVTMSAVTSGSAIPNLRRLREMLDDVEDEAEEAARGLDRFNTSALSTSLNLGPFNFALRNLLTQMPLLIMTAGTLTTVLFGLATAATAAAVGVAAIFGGGALLMAEQYAQSSEDVKNTMEGLQKVMEDVGQLFQRALGPLMNAGAMDMFRDIVEGVAVAINYVAQSIASMQGLLDQFTSTIGASFFAHFDDVVAEIEKTVVAFLPILADFFEWFMSSLPAAIEFFREKTLEFLPTLQTFGEGMLRFFRVFTEFGMTAMEGLLPAITGVMDALSSIASAFSQLPDGVIQAFFALLVVTMALRKFWTVASTGIDILGDLKVAIWDTDGALNKLKKTADAIGGPFNVWHDAIDNFQAKLGGFNSKLDDVRDNTRRRSLFPDDMFDRDIARFDRLKDAIDRFTDAFMVQMGRIRSGARNVFTSIPLFAPMTHPDWGGTVIRTEGPGLMGGDRMDLDEIPEREIEGLDAARVRLRRFKDEPMAHIRSAAGRVRTAFSDATAAVTTFALDGLGRAKAYLWDTATSMRVLADDVLNLSGKLSVLQRNWQQLGWVVSSHTFSPDLGAIRNVGLFEGMGRNEARDIDMSEFVHDSQWTPKSRTEWVPTGGLEMSRLSPRNFTLGDTGAGKRIGALRDKITGLVGDYARLASVRYQNIQHMVTEVGVISTLRQSFARLYVSVANTISHYRTLIAQKVSNIWTSITEAATLSNLGNVYQWLAGSVLVTTISQYWELISAKVTTYLSTIRETVSNYGLIGSLQLLAGSLWESATGAWGFVASLEVADVSAESLKNSLWSVNTALNVMTLGMYGVVRTIWSKLVPSFLTAEAGALSLGTVLNVAFGGLPMLLGAIAVGAGAVASALGLMGKEGGELAGVMSFLDGIMRGLMDLLVTVGIPVWNMLVEVAEWLLAPFILLNEVLTAIGQYFGLIGENGSFIVSFLKLLARTMGAIARIIEGALNMLLKVVDKLPGVNVSESLDSLKVNEEDVRGGLSEAQQRLNGPGRQAAAQGARATQRDQRGAQAGMPAGQTQRVEHNTEYNYRFGDFNMNAQDKAQVKRLVEEALEEANRSRRMRNGGI